MTPEEYNQELIELVLTQYGTIASINKQDENSLFTSALDYQIGDHQYLLLYPEISLDEDYRIVADYILAGLNGYIQKGVYE